MTQEEFERIYKFLHRKYGIDMSRKKVIVQGRLDNYIRRNRFSSYTEFMDALEAEPNGRLEKDLVDILSTNHTYFWRESDHFKYFKQVVLPELKQRERINRDLRIWCGASSTGEEPYTLAMILVDYFGLEHSKWDTTLLATDVSNDALRRAMTGIYKREAIAPLPDAYKRRFFENITGTDNFRVCDELKKEVLFRKFNLMDKLPFRKPLDVVFLRNVLIYFDEATKQRILKQVYDNLKPGGYLFIGETESINREKIPFEIVHPAVFRKPKEL